MTPFWIVAAGGEFVLRGADLCPSLDFEFVYCYCLVAP